MRYLLYIDILGFSDLVKRDSRAVQDLYEVIVSLSALRHYAFKTIVFSDTILVYNILGADTPRDKSYLVMYLCEFARDLQHRLTGRDIAFRAVLVRGEFQHYELNGVPCFFGRALIDAYKAEKEIKAIGLFIDKRIAGDSRIFKAHPYNENFSFVYITQSIERVEYLYGGRLPLDRFELEGTDLIWSLTPELLYVKRVHTQMQTHPAEDARHKYASTWALLKAHYPRTIEQLVAIDFDLEIICPGASWQEVLARFPEDFSSVIESRREY